MTIRTRLVSESESDQISYDLANHARTKITDAFRQAHDLCDTKAQRFNLAMQAFVAILNDAVPVFVSAQKVQPEEYDPLDVGLAMIHYLKKAQAEFTAKEVAS